MIKAKFYDRIFTNSSVCVDWYRDRGIPNASFLPVGICPSVHKAVTPARELACELCFAGDWNPQREYFVSELSKHFRVKVLGPWKKKIAADSPVRDALVGDFFSAEEMTSLFCSSQIVFNLHSWYKRWDHGVNPRLFEAAGAGKVQCVDYKIEIPALFPASSGWPALSYFNGLDDLVDNVKTLLKSPDKLSDIGRESRNHCLAHHTYEHRMTDMLSYL